MVVCGFPGIGKSYYVKNYNNRSIWADTHDTMFKVYDSDSSSYSWIDKNDHSKGRHPDFPNNYIKHIKAVNTDNSLVFVSSHKEVRDALKEANIPYVIVYPDLEKCYKHEYIVLRIYRRERAYEGLTETLSKNWKKWIKEINDDEYGIKLTINHNIYLDDLISDIIHVYNNYMKGK